MNGLTEAGKLRQENDKLRKAIKRAAERLGKGWGRLDEQQVSEIKVELLYALAAAAERGE